MDRIVLYDGACGLCSRSVRFLARHDRDRRLHFAPLQGETAARLRVRHPEIPVTLASVVFAEDGCAHLRSKAFVHVSRHLTWPWRGAWYLRWIPGLLLDLGYRPIAAVRYRIWGRRDECELLAPEERARFLA